MDRRDCAIVCASCCADCKGICIMQCEDACDHDEISPSEICNGSCNECSSRCETTYAQKVKDE